MVSSGWTTSSTPLLSGAEALRLFRRAKEDNPAACPSGLYRRISVLMTRRWRAECARPASPLHGRSPSARPGCQEQLAGGAGEANCLHSVQWFARNQITFILRTQGNTSAATTRLRDGVRDIAPTQPLFGIQTMEQVLGESMVLRRFMMLLIGIFAGDCSSAGTRGRL